MFSAKHSFAEIKGCKSKKNWNLPKIGGCLPTCKKVSLFSFVSGGFVFSLCFVRFCKSPPKKAISCNLKVFPLFTPKGLSLKSFSSSYSVFALFAFCLPFQNSIFFFGFCPSTHFLKTFFLGGGGFFRLSFFCLFLCECVLVSLIQTFLTSPFSNPTCFNVWFFFSVVCAFFHVLCFCFSVLCWLCFRYVLILFLFCFLFCFRLWKALLSLQL